MRSVGARASARRRARTRLRRRGLPVAIAAAAVAIALALAGPGGALAATEGLGGFRPLTPWLRPPLALPAAHQLDDAPLAEAGLRQAARWRRGSWYCEYLRCAHGPYPLVTIWGEVPLFETADALAIEQPTASHRASVERFAHAGERYWDRALGGYAPYPGDRARNVRAFFDDNGWEGIAFVNAYRATHARRWLLDAKRAFRFIATRGWDRNGGGIWWNTSHPYHSGPALAAASLLGMLLYEEDRERWQLQDVKEFVDWANAEDDHDERRLYLEQPNRPESVNDYVQAPLVYAQYLLCQAGEGEAYCVQAGRVAATMAEEDVDAFGYEYNYGPEYDTIFMQWMMAYGEGVGNGYWLALAEVNAAAADAHAVGAGGGWLSSWWGGEIADPETHPGMLRTAGATASLFAWVGAYGGEAGA